MKRVPANSMTTSADRHRLGDRLLRMIPRTVLAASLPLLAIPACTSRPPVPDPAAANSAGTTGTCQPSQLAFSLDGGDGRFNGMSHSGTLLILRNKGTVACTIPAQPVPGFTDAASQPLDITVQASPDTQTAPAAPATSPLTLAPGEHVESEMRWVSNDVYDQGHCESPAFITLAIGKETVSSAFTGHLCGAGGKPSTYTLKPFRPSASPAPAESAQTLSYDCDDGRTVQAVYPDTDTAVLTLDGERHRLHTAISADGARYVGEHWQWWTKGMHDAQLAPLDPGETYAKKNGVACRAP